MASIATMEPHLVEEPLTPPHRNDGWRSTRGLLLLFGMLLLLVQILAQQWLMGAFRSEFGAFPDEASHYVTGLMVYDFLRSGDWLRPMPFAEQFYGQYPKVGFGHWPPAFYVIQSVWSTFCGHSRLSMMALMALQSWLLAVTVLFTLKRSCGILLSLGAATILASLPIMLEHSSAVMMEITVALLCLWAVLCYQRYADAASWGWALAFGLLAALAVLSKGTGLALAFIPPLFVCALRRWHLLTKLSFYLPAIIVLVTCAPWYLYTSQMQRNGMLYESPSAEFVMQAAVFYPWSLFVNLGIGYAVLLIYAILTTSYHVAKTRQNGTGPAMVCMLLAVLIFHAMVPCGYEARHLMSALPASIILIVLGAGTLARQVTRHRPHQHWAVVWALVITASAVSSSIFGALKQSENWGFREVADELTPSTTGDRLVCLVSSDDAGEGMLVAEVASRDYRRRQYYVLRSSKVLATSRWDGSNIQPLQGTSEEIAQFLEDLAVDYVVLDDSISDEVRKERQHAELCNAIRMEPEKWKLKGAFPRVHSGVQREDAIQLYECTAKRERAIKNVHIPMNHSLGRGIVLRLP